MNTSTIGFTPGQTIYTAHANAVGGRFGMVRTLDGALSFKMTRGDGKQRTGTNPEELFACGFAACFGTTIDMAARRLGIEMAPVTINASVDLKYVDEDQFAISVKLDVFMPSLDQDIAEKLVLLANEYCPYSKATRGNIPVLLTANNKPVNMPVAA